MMIMQNKNSKEGSETLQGKNTIEAATEKGV